MIASAVLHRLKAAGVKIAVADGQLMLNPMSALSEDALSELRALKAELIELLSTTETASASQAEYVISGWRKAIRAVRFGPPEIDRLKAASLRFLDSPDAITAVENGWDAVSLFGVHEGQVPKQRIDCWGLVLFLAWGVHSCTVETIGQKVCALHTRSGAVQTQPRLRANFDQAVPWWLHPGITNTNDGDSHE